MVVGGVGVRAGGSGRRASRARRALQKSLIARRALAVEVFGVAVHLLGWGVGSGRGERGVGCVGGEGMRAATGRGCRRAVRCRASRRHFQKMRGTRRAGRSGARVARDAGGIARRSPVRARYAARGVARRFRTRSGRVRRDGGSRHAPRSSRKRCSLACSMSSNVGLGRRGGAPRRRGGTGLGGPDFGPNIAGGRGRRARAERVPSRGDVVVPPSCR